MTFNKAIYVLDVDGQFKELPILVRFQIEGFDQVKLH